MLGLSHVRVASSSSQKCPLSLQPDRHQTTRSRSSSTCLFNITPEYWATALRELLEDPEVVALVQKDYSNSGHPSVIECALALQTLDCYLRGPRFAANDKNWTQIYHLSKHCSTLVSIAVNPSISSRPQRAR